MSEDYYKARISELERQQEEANRADYNYLNIDDEQKLWELYRDSRKLFYIQGNENGLQGGSDTNKDALENAQAALKVWKERK